MGYRTCYYRTFAVGSASREMMDAYKRCRDYLDQAIALIRPGVTTGEVAAVWPKAQDFGFPNEEAAFGLQYGQGIAAEAEAAVTYALAAPYPDAADVLRHVYAGATHA